jgi:hypothetical protein
MAQYKVLQDIEAEDKLLGPLTLKQFIYGAVTIILGFIAYKLMVALNTPYVLIFFLPEMLFFGLLAAPFGIEQPNEVWLLAKFRFFLKPQIRKWNQDGSGSLVTVTVPKKIDKQLTKNFTATEAKSRLESLAKTLDTGGWSSANMTSKVVFANNFGRADEERLVDMNAMTAVQQVSDGIDADDIFDESNTQAQHINNIVSQNEVKLKDYYWNLMNPSQATSPSIELDDVRSRDYMNSAPKNTPFQPIESRFNPSAVTEVGANIIPVPENVQSPVTTQSDNAKISVLASNNNLSIASIKRELRGGDDSDEVVISLH